MPPTLVFAATTMLPPIMTSTIPHAQSAHEQGTAHIALAVAERRDGSGYAFHTRKIFFAIRKDFRNRLFSRRKKYILCLI